MKKRFPFRCQWQALLLNRKIPKDIVPIDISMFREIKGNVGLHGYRRTRAIDRENTRAYRKDTYGITIIYINTQDSSIEARTETWTGLMALCSEFELKPYRST